MSFEVISSLQNPRIKHLVRLRDGTHRRRQQRFLIEGTRECERALQAGWPMTELYFCPELFSAEDAWDLVNQLDQAGIPAFQLSKDAFTKAAFREGPDGILAIGEMKTQELSDLELPPEPLLLVMEAIEKPGNLGALLRTADAAGVDACLLVNPRTDIFNPNAIRASQGAFFSQTVVSTDNTTARLWLEDRDIRVVSMTPNTDKLLWDVDLRGPLAIAVGTENEGLSPDWLDEGVTCAALPVGGLTDSLNVSTATAIALFEAVRQRRVS